MKNFKKLIGLLFIIQLMTMLVSCSDNFAAYIGDLADNTNLPDLPANAASFNEFIPADWEVLTQCEFDFNNDSYMDYVAVINSKHEKEYEADMGYEGEIYPRTLFAVLSKDENNYDLTYKNSNIISVDMHGLTCCGYNIPKLECSEKSFVLTNFHGNNATSSYMSDIYYFTYSDNEWQILKHTEKFHRTAFIYDDNSEVSENGKLIINTDIPGIVEIEKDFEANLIKHRDKLTNDIELDENTEYFTFEYEFFDHQNSDSNGYGSDFGAEFEDDVYKYFIFTDFDKLFDDGDVIPNIAIKRLNKATDTEEIIFEYYMTEKGDNFERNYYNGDLKFDYKLGFVFLEDNEMIIRLEDEYENAKKIYRVNLSDLKAEYIGRHGIYWL